MLKRQTIALAFLASVFFSNVGLADGHLSRKGLAVVHVHSRHINREFTVGIFLALDNVRFLGIDDFGGVPFVMGFDRDKLTLLENREMIQTGSGTVKKLLSMPVKRDEFLSLLNYHDLSRNFVRQDTAGQKIWRHKKKKNMRAVFDDFRSCGEDKKLFPHRLKLSYKKYFFSLAWQKCESVEPQLSKPAVN